MQIGLHQVATPKDHPWAYSPTWRHEIAKLTVDADKVTYPGGHDPFIQQQIRRSVSCATSGRMSAAKPS